MGKKILNIVKSKNFLIGLTVGAVVGAGSVANAVNRGKQIVANPKSIVTV